MSGGGWPRKRQALRVASTFPLPPPAFLPETVDRDAAAVVELR